MERIRQAIEQAKKGRDQLPPQQRTTPRQSPIGTDTVNRERAPVPDIAGLTKLDRAHLQRNRIFAYDSLDRRTTHYDMLRTQVLQILTEAQLKSLAVTSPGPGCGKTVTALNVAFSIARQHEQSVLLIDLDSRKPMAWQYLGIKPDHGILDVATGRCHLEDAVIRPQLANGRLSILAYPQPVPQSTELLVSTQMKALTKRLQSDKRYTVIIYDLPPMLLSDDFLAFLPQVDCAMLVTAVGDSTVHEISECERLIGEDKFLGCVLNKTAQDDAGYGHYA